MEFNLILLVTFILTTFVAILHFSKPTVSKSNIYLGLFIMFFAFSIIHSVNVNSLFQTKYNPIVLIPLNLIFFPFYFLLRYFESFIAFQVFKNKFEKIVLALAFFELSTSLLPIGAWIYTKNFDRELISFVFNIKRMFVLLLLPFSIEFFITLNRKLKNYTSIKNYDKLRLKWIREFQILLMLLIIIILLPEIAFYFKFRSFSLFVLQGLVGSIIVIYAGLKNLNIEVLSAIETAKDTSSFNPESNANFILIKKLFEEEKIFMNQELKITDIADRVFLSPNYVSKIINENAKIGFNDFTNQFRIDEVLNKLRNKEYLQKTIFALAQEAGFKSKSTFQTIFKKVTGKTPTQFINDSEMTQFKGL